MYQKKSVIHKLLMSVLINNKLVLIPNKLGETATRRSKAATTNPLFDWVFVQSANFCVWKCTWHGTLRSLFSVGNNKSSYWRSLQTVWLVFGDFLFINCERGLTILPNLGSILAFNKILVQHSSNVKITALSHVWDLRLF